MTNQAKDRQFIGYPQAIEAPKTSSYRHIPGTNPVLSGTPLRIAAAAAVSIPPLAGFLWSNGGFDCLRKVDELIDYEPRYDPTVVKTSNEGGQTDDVNVRLDASYREPSNRGPYVTIAEFHEAYKAGKTTPAKVAHVLLDLVDKEPQYKHAFLSIRREDVIAAAEAATKRFEQGRPIGILDGVPIAIKDEVDLEGHPKTLGTSMNYAKPNDRTSWCVRKWQEAGGIVVGKLNMHEYGLDTTGNNPTTGTCPNPHNANYYPGGSSTASATTVASNLLPLTLGCDGGGSIRIPSSYCGIFGLKPTHDRVGRSPTVSIAFSTSVSGPMASSMSDLELGYRVMATPDPSHKTSSLFAPPIPPSPSPKRGKAPLGICKSWFDTADPAVLNLCHAALSHYESLGHEIIDIDLPYLHQGQIAHALTIMTEASTSVSRIRDFTPATQILLAVFRQTPSLDFLLAQKLRNMLMTHLASLFQKHPGLLIVTPTTPNAGWPVRHLSDLKTCGDGGVGFSDGNMSLRNMTYIWLANFTGCPAISVPVGMAKGEKGKVPVGMMAMGEWGDEDGCIEWGRIMEGWAWGTGTGTGTGTGVGRMERPGDWVDVLGLAGGR